MKINDIEEIVRFSYLLDFYGALLNDRQRQICNGYVFDNLSLAELADIYDMSRQGVHDILKRAKAKLEDFEDKLDLEKKHSKIWELSKEARERVELLSLNDTSKNDKDSDTKRIVGEISNILDEIAEVI